MVVHTFSSNTPESEAAESVSMKPAYSAETYRTPGHPGLHNESQSQTNKEYTYGLFR